MNRRDLMKLAAARVAAGALPVGMVATSASAESKSAPAIQTLKNTQFELSLTRGTGLQCKLVHRPTGTVLADGLYSYSFATPTLSKAKEDGTSLVLHGETDIGLRIRHRFIVDPAASWIEEEIEFTNAGSTPLEVT